MSQYTPIPALRPPPPFDRRLARGEYDRVLDAVERLGFGNVFIQPMEDEGARDPFLPDFREKTRFRSRGGAGLRGGARAARMEAWK